MASSKLGGDLFGRFSAGPGAADVGEGRRDGGAGRAGRGAHAPGSRRRAAQGGAGAPARRAGGTMEGSPGRLLELLVTTDIVVDIGLTFSLNTYTVP